MCGWIGLDFILKKEKECWIPISIKINRVSIFKENTFNGKVLGIKLFGKCNVSSWDVRPTFVES